MNAYMPLRVLPTGVLLIQSPAFMRLYCLDSSYQPRNPLTAIISVRYIHSCQYIHICFYTCIPLNMRSSTGGYFDKLAEDALYAFGGNSDTLSRSSISPFSQQRSVNTSPGAPNLATPSGECVFLVSFVHTFLQGRCMHLDKCMHIGHEYVCVYVSSPLY